MELKDQLEICRKCNNKKLPETPGPIVCSLTNQLPTFDNSCKDFVKDENEPEDYLDNGFILSFEEIKKKSEPEVFARLLMDQDIIKALVMGLIASIIGAIIWALVSYFTGWQVGYMALGIGALVGFAIRYFGKGIHMNFAILGAVISLFGCLLGNFLTVIAFASHEYETGYFQVINNIGFKDIIPIMVSTFSIMDIVFYGIAIYEGFRLSTIKFTEKTLWQYSKSIRNVC